MLHWALQPVTENSNPKTKSAYIIAVQWRDAPLTPTNVPPSELNSLTIAAESRLIKLQPISWEIHDNWVKGISLLLKRTRSTIPLKDQFKMLQDYQNESDEDSKTPKSNSNVEVLTGSDATLKHRRVHTMITASKIHSSTPRKLKEHHRRITAREDFTPTQENPFLVTSSSSTLFSPRKFSISRNK
jgi:hypothetical protein